MNEVSVARCRCGVYARVSTTNGQDPEMQLREIRAYIEQRGWTTSAEYVDVGVSGAKAKRPALDRLMADAREGRLDAVVVWRFDRFARSVRHLLAALDEFNASKIAFVSIREAVDFGSPLGRAMFVIVSAISELEREIIRERVCSGVARARARGKKLGRPRKWNSKAVETAKKMRDAGESWRTIAQATGTKVRTIRRAVAESSAA